jgi:hypothetical protein
MDRAHLEPERAVSHGTQSTVIDSSLARTQNPRIVERKTLELLRCVVPGGIVLGYVYAAARVYHVADSLEREQWFILKRDAALLIAAAVIGYLWHQSHFRDPDYLPRLNRIRHNIRSGLLAIVSADPYVTDRREELMKDPRLMEVFYNLIDNDNSLKEKALGVRMSGLAMTSASDLFLLSLGSAVIYSIFAAADRFRGLPERFFVVHGWRVSQFAMLAAAASVLALFGRTLAPHLEQRHRQNSNEQLYYIGTMLKDQLLERLHKL